MLKADLLQPELKQWCGELISAQDVKDDWFRIRIGRLVCDAQANLATRLSGILAAEKNQDKIFALLTNEADHASEGLCNANLKEAEDNSSAVPSDFEDTRSLVRAFYAGLRSDPLPRQGRKGRNCRCIEHSRGNR